MQQTSHPTRGMLADFLKSRRARLRPRDVGIPTHSRRRLTGLRREEVAALAGVGDTWYGLLESGKPIRVSRELLECVGAALRLSDEERVYLHSLVAEDFEAERDYERETIGDGVRRTLASIAAPAFVIGPRLDYLDMNAPCRELYRISPSRREVQMNLAVMIFLEPEGREIFPDWDRSAARAVAKLRVHYASHIGNASFERLIARLQAESPEFRALWALHDVEFRYEAVSRALRRRDGSLYAYTLQSFSVAEQSEQSLIILLPATA